MKKETVVKYVLSDTERERLSQIPSEVCSFIECRQYDCEECPLDAVTDEYKTAVANLRRVIRNME